jgi:hypothetical protein
MVANAPINAILFAVYGGSMRRLNEHYGAANVKPMHHFLAGALGGLVQCTFSCPSELIKILLQVSIFLPRVCLLFPRSSGVRKIHYIPDLLDA